MNNLEKKFRELFRKDIVEIGIFFKFYNIINTFILSITVESKECFKLYITSPLNKNDIKKTVYVRNNVIVHHTDLYCSQKDFTEIIINLFINNILIGARRNSYNIRENIDSIRECMNSPEAPNIPYILKINMNL